MIIRNGAMRVSREEWRWLQYLSTTYEELTVVLDETEISPAVFIVINNQHVNIISV